MSSEMVRWGGLAGLAAGAMFVLSGVLTFIVAPPPQGALGSFGAYLLEVVIVAAFALTLVAIAGLHAAQSRSGRYGLPGAAGSLLTFVGYAIVLVVAHVIRLAGGEPILSVRPVGVVGARRLDTPGSHGPIRAVLPWWCGVLLIFGFPLGALLENVRAGIENIVFAVVWGSIGYALLSRRSTEAEQPSRVS